MRTKLVITGFDVSYIHDTGSLNDFFFHVVEVLSNRVGITVNLTIWHTAHNTDNIAININILLDNPMIKGAHNI